MPTSRKGLSSPQESLLNSSDLVECIEAYFASTDTFDVAATLRTMTHDCTLEYLSADIFHEGRDTGIKKYFEQRAQTLSSAWHGNFLHTVDVEHGRVATRFDVRRRETDGTIVVRDNLNLFQFEDRLINRISVWRSSSKISSQ